VVHFLIFLLVLGGAAFYFMTPDERIRTLRVIRKGLLDARDAITLQGLGCDGFFDALRARTRRVIVAPFLILFSVAISVVSWGSISVSPTANSEWWRPVGNVFIHSSILDLLVNGACILQLGLILERLVGRLAFTTIYIATGIAACLVSLALSPDASSIGASGSVVGLYGLALVTSIRGLMDRSSLTLPLNVVKRLVPVAAFFVLYHMVRSGIGFAAQLTALDVGLIGGFVVARHVGDDTPPFRPLATAMTVVLAIVMVYAMIVKPGRVESTTDVRPEIQRVLAVEHRTVGLYDAAVGQFKKGRLTAGALAQVIDETIVPEVRALAVRLRALPDIQPGDRPLVTTVQEFLKLRDESWRLRAEALRKGDMLALRQADDKEQTSLEALQRIKAHIS
jgi:membrane associated rhomboid family serine protease